MAYIRINRRELATGAIFILFGLFFFQSAYRGLTIGTSLSMGPGYFPIMLSGLLVILGTGVIASGVNAAETPVGAWPWRGILCIGVAPIIFALTVQRLGLVIGIFLLGMVAAFASKRMTLRFALPLSLGLSGFCFLVFKYLLELPIPVFGDWVRW